MGSGVNVAAYSIVNNGQLSSFDADLELRSQTFLKNTQTISTNADAVLNLAGDLVNSGTLLAEQALVIAGLGPNSAIGGLTNQAGGEIKASTVTARVSSLDNEGLIGAVNGTLDLSNNGDLTNSGRLIAKGDATLKVDGKVTNSGDIASEGVLTLKNTSGGATGTFTNTAEAKFRAASIDATVASVANDGLIGSAEGSVTLTSQAGVQNRGLLLAKEGLTLSLAGDLVNSGTLLAEQALVIAGLGTETAIGALSNAAGGEIKASTVTARVSSLDNGGLIGAVSGTLDLTNSGDLINSGRLVAKGDATLKVDGKVTNSGDIASEGALTLKNTSGGATGAFVNTAEAKLRAASLDLAVASVANDGLIGSAEGSVILTSQAGIQNSGQLLAKEGLTLSLAGDLVNSGTLLAEQALVIAGLGTETAIGALSNAAGGEIKASTVTARVSSLDNGGLIGAVNGTLDLTNNGDLTNSGRLIAKGDATLKVDGKVTNSGDIASEGALTLKNTSGGATGAFVNTAEAKLRAASLDLAVASVANDGLIGSAEGSVILSSQAGVENRGLLLAKEGLSLTLVGDLTNSGTLLAEQALVIAGLGTETAIGALSNAAGGEIKASTVTARVSSLDNGGLIGAVSGTLDLTNSGDLINSGRLVAKGDATLKVDGKVTNSGDIASEGALTLKNTSGGATGAFVNTAEAKLRAASLDLAVASVANDGLIGSAEGSVTLTSQAGVQNSGQLLAKEGLTLSLAGDLVNSGTLLAEQALEIAGLGTDTAIGALSNQVGGEIKASTVTARVSSLDNGGLIGAVNGALALTNSGDLINSGRLVAKGDATLTVDGSVTNSGDIASEGALTLTNASGGATGAFVNTAEAKLRAASLDLAVASVANDGLIGSAEGSVTLTSQAGVQNSGQLLAKEGLTLSLTGDLDNSGTLLAEQALVIAGLGTDTAIGALSNAAGGEIKASTVTARVSSLDNGGLIGAVNGALALTNSGDLINSGRLVAKGDATLTVDGSVTNSGDIASEGALTLTNASGGATGAFVNTAEAKLRAASLDLAVASVANDGLIGSAEGSVTLSSQAGVQNSGQLLAKEGLTLSLAGDLVNSGTLLAEQALVIAGLGSETAIGALSNAASGEIKASTVSARVSSLDNAGLIGAVNGALALTNSGDLINSGRLVAKGDATLTVDGSVTNSGDIASEGALTLTNTSGAATGVFTNTKDAKLRAASLDLAVASVANDGLIGSAEGSVTLTSQAGIQNSGQLLAKEGLTLSLAGDLTNSGTLLAEQALEIAGLGPETAIGALSNAAGGEIKASTVTARVSSLDNGGLIGAVNGSLDLTNSGDLINSGRLVAKGDATLTVDGSVTNSGDIASEGALTLKNTSGGATGAFTNASEAKLIGGTANLRIRSLDNDGLLGARAGTLSLHLNGDFENSGKLASTGSISLKTDGSVENSGKLLSDQIIRIQGASNAEVAQFHNKSGGEIKSQGLESTSSSFSNAGTIQVGAAGIAINSVSSWTNTAEIETSGGLVIASDGNIANQGDGTLKSDGILTLTGHTGTNAKAVFNEADALVSGAGGVVLNAENFTNEGRVGSQDGDVDIALTENLANGGLIYAGQDVTAKVNGEIRNTGGDILAEENIRLVGLDKVRAGSLINETGGVIEAVAGDLRIDADLIKNLTDKPVVTQKVYAPVEETEGNPDTRPGLSGGRTNIWIVRTIKKTVDEIASLPAVSRLLSGRDFVASANSFENAYGQVAANNNVSISSGSLTNTAQDLIEAVTVDTVERHTWAVKKKWGGKKWKKKYLEYSDTTTKTLGASFGTIEAGNNLTIDVEGFVKNEAIRENAGQVGLSSGNRKIAESVDAPSNAVDVESVAIGGPANSKVSTDANVSGTNVDLRAGTNLTTATANVGTTSKNVTAKANVKTSAETGSTSTDVKTKVETKNTSAVVSTQPDEKIEAKNNQDKVVTETDLSEVEKQTPPEKQIVDDIKNLQNRKHLFVSNKDPDAPYKIETRSDFIDPGKYLGSDYFLKKVGLDKPGSQQKRLGDGFVETKLIRDQIFELTGKRYLKDEADERTQLEQLYNSAATEKERLHLTVGTSLSPDMVASLTEDIVWLERQLVDGEEVLVPRVYLASAPQPTSSARLTGKNVSIASGSLTNSGDIVASADLEIEGTGSVKNVGGRLLSGEQLSITAGDVFSNLSGSVQGTDITITAESLINETLTTRDLSSQGYADRLQSKAEISALGNLKINTTGDITSLGGLLSAGVDLNLTAGGDVKLAGIGLERNRETYFKGGHDKAYSLTHELAEVSAGSNLSISAANDIGFEGVDLSSGGDANLTAGNDVTIAAVTDINETDFKLKIKGSGIFGGGLNQKNYSYQETIVGSTLDVENDLNITSGQDSNILASTLAAGDNLSVDAGGALNVEGLSGDTTSQNYEKSTGFLSKKSHTRNVSSENYTTSSLIAGNDLILDAEKDLTITASSVVGGGDVSLSGENVSLETSETQSSVFDQKKKSGFFAGGADGGFGFSVGYRSQKDKTDQNGTTRIVSNVNAGKSLTITADNDITSEAALLTAEEDITLEAGNDVKLTSTSETQNYNESHKLDEIALTVAIRENVSRNVEALINAPQEATKGKGNGFNKAVTAASAALKAAEAAQALVTGPLISNEIGIGVSSKKSRFTSETVSERVGQVNAGQDLIVKAGQDIISEGTQMSAERDVTLEAGRDITLEAAETETSSSNKSSERSAGIKATVGVGLTGVSAGVSGTVSGQNSKGHNSSNTKTNALVQAGETVTLISGEDTALKGARVLGETITADIGGDLNIESLQDTASGKNKTRGGSAGVSISSNSVSVNGSINLADGSSSKAWVGEQTGLYGKEKVDVRVESNTDLKGGVINSESGDLKLDTGTLTFSDIQDHDKSSQTSVSVSASLSMTTEGDNALQETLGDVQDAGQDVVDKVDQPTEAELKQREAKADPGQVSPGGSVEGSYGSKDKEQITRATVGEGEIIIRDEDKQQELEDSGETENVAELNRDIDAAQEVTKDEEEYVGVYVSDTAVRAAIEAGAKVAEVAELIIDKMLEDDKIPEADKSAVEEIKKHLDDPEVVAQLQACQASGQSASFSLWDLIIPKAHAIAPVLAFCGGLLAEGGAVLGGVGISAETVALLLAAVTGGTIAYDKIKDEQEKAATTTSALALAFVVLNRDRAADDDIYEEIKAEGGKLITISGVGNELIRNIIITYPTGEEVSLRVFVTPEDKGFVVDQGFVNGERMPETMLEGMAADLSGNGFNVLYKTDTNSDIPTIGGHRPKNYTWAGRTHPSGLEFDKQGFPKFEPHTETKVQAENLTGVYAKDEKIANRAAGFDKTPDGYVWHHHQDGKSLLLVPKNLHNSCRHTGGCAVIRNGGSFD
ncbi:hemagglutinin repeat-containing protein [Pseudovibrio sp. Tun.PSC04-5.I4]|uniref:hemagglutinin repeat-containing protein n=1 Tax=Pseudovibrio sp. Tun.PSC04-5.I4 TaxID=1798213 RepID=UPI000B833D44|nr:hemagglutinin repeat-containing protein [Pseudovibrio sp. Tun.PSC04-5.I4]